MKRDLTDEQLRQEVTVVLPLSVVLRIGGDQAIAQEVPALFGGSIIASHGLPAIGAEYKGGKFAGVSLSGDCPVALVLLPDEAESINWKGAGEWAAKQGGVLPSRHDGIVLFNNLKSEFKDAWYWLDSQHAGEPDYAWYQAFYLGTQSWSHVSSAYRACAVRRLPLQ